MTTRRLMQGNEAMAEAAIQAGCRAYFAYPITPATEILEYMARRMPEVGGIFMQPESELAAINMCAGSACAGLRTMTSSSSTGISLMQETISTLATAELPCVIVNIMRGGPGLGNVAPSQADYFQATKGGGHGDYRVITLAPASVREAVDLTVLAFHLADLYRTPVNLLADGIIGHIMEPVIWPDICSSAPAKDWATTGAIGRERRLILAQPGIGPELMALNKVLQAKFADITRQEQRWETRSAADARLMVVAFGIAARVAEEAIEEVRAAGLPVGLIRPITLWPFPQQAFDSLAGVRGILTLELNTGQMVEDVRLAVNGRIPVRFYGYGGGWVPDPESVEQAIREFWAEVQP